MLKRNHVNTGIKKGEHFIKHLLFYICYFNNHNNPVGKYRNWVTEILSNLFKITKLVNILPTIILNTNSKTQALFAISHCLNAHFYIDWKCCQSFSFQRKMSSKPPKTFWCGDIIESLTGKNTLPWRSHHFCILIIIQTSLFPETTLY